MPTHPPTCTGPEDILRRRASNAFRAAFVLSALVVLSACEQNAFVPPPPPKVEVGPPTQRAITRYLEATGTTAAIKNVDLVARVQGFLQSINYKDGTEVKAGTTLFTIEPDTYKLKLEQAQAAEAGAQASVKQTEADFKRQSDLVQRQVVSQATLDTSSSARDNAQANLLQALELTNGNLFNDAMKKAAEKWKNKYPDPQEMIRQVYRNALGRMPKKEEETIALKALQQSPTVGGVQDFLWAIAVHPEFQLIF